MPPRTSTWTRWSSFLLLLVFSREASAQSLTCAAWCDLMSDHCSEEVLHDEAFCLDYCEHPDLDVIDPGSLSDTTGNTLGCRIHHALQAAATNGATREAHCAAAAMTGGGVCGDYCEVYCDLALETCNPVNNAAYSGSPIFAPGGVPSRAQCLAACSGYPEDVLEGISQTDQLFGYGDTVQCRIHHLQAAVVEGQDKASAYGLHCGHSAPVSDGALCSDIAEPNVINYCVFALQHCTSGNAILPPGTEHADCVAILNESLIAGDYQEGGFESFADTATNSVGCLNNRIMLAAQDAVTYCAAGDYDRTNWVPAGDAVCAAPSTAVPSTSHGLWLLAFALVVSGVLGLGFSEMRRF